MIVQFEERLLIIGHLHQRINGEFDLILPLRVVFVVQSADSEPNI